MKKLLLTLFLFIGIFLGISNINADNKINDIIESFGNFKYSKEDFVYKNISKDFLLSTKDEYKKSNAILIKLESIEKKLNKMGFKDINGEDINESNIDIKVFFDYAYNKNKLIENLGKILILKEIKKSYNYKTIFYTYLEHNNISYGDFPLGGFLDIEFMLSDNSFYNVDYLLKSENIEGDLKQTIENLKENIKKMIINHKKIKHLLK